MLHKLPSNVKFEKESCKYMKPILLDLILKDAIRSPIYLISRVDSPFIYLNHISIVIYNKNIYIYMFRQMIYVYTMLLS